MCRKLARGTVLVGLAVTFIGRPAESGSITGRREDQYGDGVHESLIWAVGVGNNPSGAHGIALAWWGNFSINNLPAGQYYLAGNAHGVAPHAILDSPITVPAWGSVEVNLRDRITMNSQGLTDLDSCRWAAQTFIATGRGLDEVAVISPDGGSRVSISVREDVPEGRQIGPARIVTNGSLFPAGARWLPGEVPLIPGRRYALRLDGVGGKHLDAGSCVPAARLPEWSRVVRRRAGARGRPEGGHLLPGHRLYRRLQRQQLVAVENVPRTAANLHSSRQ